MLENKFPGLRIDPVWGEFGFGWVTCVSDRPYQGGSRLSGCDQGDPLAPPYSLTVASYSWKLDFLEIISSIATYVEYGLVPKAPRFLAQIKSMLIPWQGNQFDDEKGHAPYKVSLFAENHVTTVKTRCQLALSLQWQGVPMGCRIFGKWNAY